VEINFYGLLSWPIRVKPETKALRFFNEKIKHIAMWRKILEMMYTAFKTNKPYDRNFFKTQLKVQEVYGE
jgi:hypothetical protein